MQNYDRNHKMKIWVYAVILFTSAFVVLLLTAMSQIKFNRHIDQYKAQIYEQEGENQKFKLNLTSALDENVQLKENLNSVKSELDKVKKELEEEKKATAGITADYERKLRIYQILIQAQNAYDRGNITESAETLIRNINPDELDEAERQHYESLKNKTYKKAALLLYNEGYKDYRKRMYSSARKSFSRSLMYSDTDYFSDDCYYYLAYIAYKEGDKASAAAYIKTLADKYPGSNYIDDGKQLLKLIEK